MHIIKKKVFIHVNWLVLEQGFGTIVGINLDVFHYFLIKQWDKLKNGTRSGNRTRTSEETGF